MDVNGYSFIIMVKGCKEMVNKQILEVRGTFEDEWEHSIEYYDVNGITTTGYALPKDEKERYIHICYSDYRKAKERARIRKNSSAVTNRIWVTDVCVFITMNLCTVRFVLNLWR